MIVLVDASNEQDFLNFCNTEPCFGPLVYTQYRCYKGLRMALFWASVQEGCVRGAISSVGGIFSVACLACVREEIALFLHFMSWQEVQGQEELLSLLSDLMPTPPRYTPGMLYHGGIALEKSEAVCADYREYPQLFSLLCRSYPDFDATISYDEWLSNITLAVARGMASCFAICLDGQPVCCGMISHRSAAHCRIGSIATLPSHRGRGFASAMVKHLTATALEQNLIPALHCAAPSLMQFYAPLGYQSVGLWPVATGRLLSANLG